MPAYIAASITMREQNQFNTALKVLVSYLEEIKNKKNLPLHQFLKDYFRKNKQMGSNDRRNTSRLLYNYFRMGKILNALDTHTRITIGNFICEQNIESENFMSLLKFILSKYSSFSITDLGLSLEEKFDLLKIQYPSFELKDVFPYGIYLSNEINQEKFYQSFFIQPKLWIRIPKIAGIQNFEYLLEKENISFQTYEEYPQTISLKNKTSLDQWKGNWVFEVQDLSSQLAGDFFQPKEYDNWWDCCSGSGGKSLLLIEKNCNINIFATDERESILKNYELRMKNAGFKNFSTQQIDLTSNFKFKTSNLEFDGIIVDAPCSGSGTWSRTPEMLSQFSDSEIERFYQRQKKIVQNVIPYLKKGKPLIYITCSVFQRENEDVVKFLVEECKMKLEKSELIKGYDKGADNLFVARLVK